MLEQLFVSKATVAFMDDRLRLCEEFNIDDGLVRVVAAYPFSRVICDAWFLKLGARSVVDIVADVFLVCEEIVDGAPRPRSSPFCRNTFLVQQCGDLCFGTLLDGEKVIDPVHDGNLRLWPWHEDHAFELETLALAPCEDGFGLTVLVK